MTWPGHRFKALTLSYDDGVTTDRRMIKTLKNFGIKATFNINTQNLGKGGENLPKGKFDRLSLEEIKEVYSNTPHEVAVHTLHHKWMTTMNPVEAIGEILEDKRNIEQLFGTVVRGMAYPFGPTCEDIEKVVKACGIVYARTTKFTNSFDIPVPESLTHLAATCHHKSPEFERLTDLYAQMSYNRPSLFYLWGHSYEFERDDNWELLEGFCKKLGGRDDIWYATNIEVFDYIEAYRSLCSSANVDRIYNPSAIPVYVEVNGKELMVIEGGATVEIK